MVRRQSKLSDVVDKPVESSQDTMLTFLVPLSETCLAALADRSRQAHPELLLKSKALRDQSRAFRRIHVRKSKLKRFDLYGKPVRTAQTKSLVARVRPLRSPVCVLQPTDVVGVFERRANDTNYTEIMFTEDVSMITT